jgi:hypothetical protein
MRILRFRTSQTGRRLHRKSTTNKRNNNYDVNVGGNINKNIFIIVKVGTAGAKEKDATVSL